MSLTVLQQSIEEALSVTATKDNVAAQKTLVARKIAEAVDAYIQEQIGVRLSQITSAIVIPCPTQAGVIPVAPNAGTNYTTFIRQR